MSNFPDRLEVCEKCLRQKSILDMTSINFRGKTTYECSDEKDCRLNNKKIIEEEELKRIEKEKRDKCKGLTKEEQFNAMFNLNFDDLEELKERYRDASIHYRHKETNKIYSWCFATNYWYQSNLKPASCFE